MKKPTKIIIGIVTLFLVLAFVLFWPANREESLRVQGEATSLAKTSSVPSGVSPTIGSTTLATNSLSALMQTPIDFYGVVLDQAGNPVPSAKISASVLDNMVRGSPISVITDATGKFTIKSKGRSLHIEVSKSGYYYVEKGGALKPSSQGFDFGLDGGRGIYQPDAASPTVFHLRKAGNPVQLDALRGQSKVPRDGSPITISLSETSQITLTISCHTLEDDTQLPNAPYDWRCEITSEGGGIQEAKDEHSFLAPSEGYTQLALIDMPKTLDPKQWNSRASKNYWLRFPDSTFGKIRFMMVARGDHFAVINGFRNPTPNDRNLEPKLDTK